MERAIYKLWLLGTQESRCKLIEDFLKFKTENTALQIILNVFTTTLILTVSFNQQKHVTKLKRIILNYKYQIKIVTFCITGWCSCLWSRGHCSRQRPDQA